MSSSTDEYLAVVARRRGVALVVTTMTASKVWPLHADGATDLDYLPSAMSHASDLAVGLALARPERRVLCLNGDGSLLMNLGTLATTAAAGTTNLVMLVLVNRQYRIVGGSPVPGADRMRWGDMALASGWGAAARCDSAEELDSRWSELWRARGPTLVELTVVDTVDMRQRLPRRHPGAALRELRRALSSGEPHGSG